MSDFLAYLFAELRDHMNEQYNAAMSDDGNNVDRIDYHNQKAIEILAKIESMIGGGE